MSKHTRNRKQDAGDRAGLARWGLIGLLAAAAVVAVVLALQGTDAGAEVTHTPLGEQVTDLSSETAASAAQAEPGRGAKPVDDRPREVFVEGKNGLPDFTYRLPEPGDADYDDWQEMIHHPEYARFNHDRTLPMYYDPEWRAQVNGRRDVPVNTLQLAGGATSVDELLTFVLLALADEDGDSIDQLRVNRDEFQLLCWPEFPQSRPYLKIPPDEAWSFHFASMRKGAKKAFQTWSGKPLDLVTFSVGSTREFTNFRLLEDVSETVLDADTGEEQELGAIEAILACRGRYKVFMYRD